MSNLVTIFEQFRFNTTSRLLTDGNTPVHLGARAIAILDALVETPGRLVPKAALLDRAWPGLTVDEANLKVQISTLRKALGGRESLIQAEGSLGYRFVGNVVKGGSFDAPAAKHRFDASRRVTTPIGRNKVVRSVIELFEQNRLVTIFGPGGIGKTTVALEVANKLGSTYADGACVVDLSRVASADQARATIIEALDGFVEGEPTFEQLLLRLHGKRLLLILDSTDHVTEKMARFVERVLSETDYTDILVTARESLRVEGEALLLLEPLETPPTSLRLTAADIDEYPSMELFVRTARRGAFDCQIDDTAAGVIAEVCRKLDGIPLAIELAASNVGVLGIEGVRRRLDEHSSVLSMDRRTSVFRQRSMAATIDWSYQLLPEKAKAVLRRLSIFANPFSLQAAISVASDDELSATAVREAVFALTTKSFLILDQQAAPPKYRMLKTIRAYACQAQDPIADRKRAEDRCARHLVGFRKQLNCGPTSYPTEPMNMLHSSESGVALNWNFMNGFLLRRLASFHRVREPGGMRAGFAIGSDRSGRIPLA